VSDAVHRLVARVAVAVVTIYVALTATFLLVTLAPNTAVQGKVAAASFASGGSLTEQELEQLRRTYRAARGLDRPLAVRYVGYLADMSLLRWGVSFHYDAPVTALIADRLARTLSYALPGFLLAVALGVAGGLYSALREGTVDDRLLRIGAYLGFGIPNFWVAALALWLLALPPVVEQFGPAWALRQQLLPAALLATTLFAGQLAYTRAESREVAGADFVRFSRAKGLSRLRVGAHVLRAAAAPVVTLFVTDLLAVLVLAVYVLEFAFDVHGFGRLSYVAAVERDTPLLLGTALVVVVTGVVGTLCSELVTVRLDPRTGSETE
jgi:peptide/nickel transport system permease protein